MVDTRRRLILGNGELYVQPVKKAFPGRTPEPPHTYEEARDILKAGVQGALKMFAALPLAERLADEAVFCLRLHPDAVAKSYDPTALFADSPQLQRWVLETAEQESRTSLRPNALSRSARNPKSSRDVWSLCAAPPRDSESSCRSSIAPSPRFPRGCRQSFGGSSGSMH